MWDALKVNVVAKYDKLQNVEDGSILYHCSH